MSNGVLEFFDKFFYSHLLINKLLGDRIHKTPLFSFRLLKQLLSKVRELLGSISTVAV